MNSLKITPIKYFDVWSNNQATKTTWAAIIKHKQKIEQQRRKRENTQKFVYSVRSNTDIV